MTELPGGRLTAATAKAKRRVRAVVLVITGLILLIGVISAMNGRDTTSSQGPRLAGRPSPPAGTDLKVGGIGVRPGMASSPSSWTASRR